MEGGRTVTKTYIVAVPLLLLWLVCWIVFSWGAMQDDALIHLRYADNLALHHFITYDGVHANYGASSLLYVSALAVPSPTHFLTGVTPCGVERYAPLALRLAHNPLWSSCTPLRAGGQGRDLCCCCYSARPRRCAGSTMAWRRLLVLVLISLLAWILHTERFGRRSSWPRYGLMVLLSFLAVMLRIELLLLCVGGFSMLAMGRFSSSKNWWETGGVTLYRFAEAVMRSAHLLIGGALALVVIYATMHELLPDTALAKSHGIGSWFNPLHDTASTLGSALSFGLGTCCFWLLTCALVARRDGKIKAATAIANGLFPILLLSSVLRGQEIQGVPLLRLDVRVCDCMEHFRACTRESRRVQEPIEQTRTLADTSKRTSRMALSLVYCFLGCIALVLPRRR